MLENIFRSFAQLVDEPIVECIECFDLSQATHSFIQYINIKQQTFIFILEIIDIFWKSNNDSFE